MVEIGRYSVKDSHSVLQLRRKILNLEKALGIKNIQAMRSASVLSALFRDILKNNGKGEFTVEINTYKGNETLIYKLGYTGDSVINTALFSMYDDIRLTESEKMRIFCLESSLPDTGITDQNTIDRITASFGELSKEELFSRVEEAKDEAVAATKAKSDFLANMSHEIRTPMNAIIGLSHLIQKTELSAKQDDYINKIHGSAYNLLGIINDILDFSKIEAGKLNIESIDFNLNHVFENLGSMVAQKAQDKELELIFHIKSEVPCKLVGDPLRLGQILLNLSNNAVKFTEKGEILVQAELVSRRDSKAVIKFSIQDSGIGLTEEQQGRLFKSFSQADTSTTRKFGGTGLGLSISKRLSEMMGGEIGVESIYEEGSTFFFTALFPIREEEQKDIVPSGIKDLEVLVVDDSPTSREILADYLSNLSFKPTLAENGEEAIEKIRKEKTRYGLILMDYRMPGLNGAQTLKEIHNVLKDAAKPKSILTTAIDRDEVEAEEDNPDFDSFILKPINQEVLFCRIMQVFGQERHEEDPLNEPGFPEGFDSVRGARILLAEDNKINQQVAVEILESEGFFVDIAENGRESIERAKESQYDLILMDLQMPVMCGCEAAEIIRSSEGMELLPIIAMTADAMSGVQEQVIEAGMNDYLTKPIDINRLWQVLVRWIPDGKRNMNRKFKIADIDHSPWEIPPISGIDINDGLKRINNNKKLFTKLLLDFSRDFKEFPSEMAALIKENKKSDALRLAHTLKGVSANLGARKLQAHAGKLENYIKSGENPDVILNSTVFQVEKIVGIINRSRLDVNYSNNNCNLKKEIPESELKETLTELADSLNGRKPMLARKTLDELYSYKIPENISPQIDQVQEHLQKYKMKEAVKIISHLVNTL